MFETFIDAMGMERPAERPDDRFVLSGEMTPGLERLFAECGGGDENRIYVFDCATMEVLYFDQHVIDYHTITLVEDREDQFAASLYFELLEYLGLPGLPFDKCLGYTRPLFLSGNNDPDNYELIDMEVNWSISCQIYEQIKDLPDGTPIGEIKIAGHEVAGTRYWFEFAAASLLELPAGIGYGCGVTAYSYEDAIRMLDEKVFRQRKRPPFTRIIENVDVRNLDQGHVVPNMGMLVLHGIWFPMGFE